MYKDRLIILADFLLSVPRPNFSLTYWAKNRDDNYPDIQNIDLYSCSMTAYAGGWATAITAFKELGLRLEERSDCPDQGVSIVFNGNKDFGAIQEFFGLNLSQADYLFYPLCYAIKYRKDPVYVSDRIKKLVEDDGVLPESFYGI